MTAQDLVEFYADVVAAYALDAKGLLRLLAATWGLGARH